MAVPDRSQFEMLKDLELAPAEFTELFSYCRTKKMLCLSTPFDTASAKLLSKFKLPLFKIGSGEITNLPLLALVASFKKPIIISTGMSEMADIRLAVKTIQSVGNKQIVLLQCTSNYPAQAKDINLRAMDQLHTAFDLPVGFSDHTQGIAVATAAAARGACVIEKHFTLDRSMAGPDHTASLEPDELSQLVKSIRQVESALGSGKKAIQPVERSISRVARKSVVLVNDLKAGTTIVQDDLQIMRPGTGIAPKYLSSLVGKKLKRSLKRGSVLKWEQLR
jgi:N-acetylneuraminate synthase/N,N'-diacetyllegionaminate synthase